MHESRCRTGQLADDGLCCLFCIQVLGRMAEWVLRALRLLLVRNTRFSVWKVAMTRVLRGCVTACQAAGRGASVQPAPSGQAPSAPALGTLHPGVVQVGSWVIWGVIQDPRATLLVSILAFIFLCAMFILCGRACCQWACCQILAAGADPCESQSQTATGACAYFFSGRLVDPLFCTVSAHPSLQLLWTA